MAEPLLEAKVRIPVVPGSLVARPRLGRLLGGIAPGPGPSLTLVSAPAGFGKTTLLADAALAARAQGSAVAWVGLDDRDNDPRVFWTYLLTSLERAVPGVGAAALALHEAGDRSPEEVLPTLLNDLQAALGQIVLVLDDYHLIEAPDVHRAMTFLAEHLPAHVRLVVATRVDPPWPLARLRARGALVELRAADLRFTREEAAHYLTGSMGLALTGPDVAALEERTEGWIAALQLAALSLRGREDPAAFIAGFAGDDRYIVDYLVEEVLARQGEPVRSFLLQTALLRRLTGSLCDAVTGQPGGAAMLASLERGDVFLVSLDDRRQWYRYHQLFADVLRARLRDEQPDLVATLHRRASDWYAADGDTQEAIHHALAAADWAHAADLVELALPAMRRERQEAQLRGWLEALPDEVLRVRPVLGIGYAAVLMGGGDFPGVEARLREAEQQLGRADAVVADQAALASLPSTIAMYRAGLALVAGDAPRTITHAHEALAHVGQADHVGRGAPTGLLGLAHWRLGDLAAAHRWFADSVASLARAGHVADVIASTVLLADIEIGLGHLREAMRTYRGGLALASGTALPGTADLHVGMSAIRREQGDLEAAGRELERAADLGEHASLPQYRARTLVTTALQRLAGGDAHAALDLLDRAEARATQGYAPDVRPVAALRARVWLAQGRWADALRWADARGLSVDDEPHYLREFEHLTLVRALVAQHAAAPTPDPLAGAGRLLERLLPAAEAGARTASVIEILILQARTRQAAGDTAGALTRLARALDLAEPEGWVQVFVDEGPTLAPLLQSAPADGVVADHARRLASKIGSPHVARPTPTAGTDPLSDREREVLRLLGTDLGGPEIARTLFISLNTLRSHTRSIYTKLGVTSRRAAVRRAEEAGLTGSHQEDHHMW